MIARVKSQKVEPVEAEPVVGEDDKPAEADGLTIIVGPDWRMVWDSHQFQVQERKVNQKGKNVGKEYWTNRAYITSLDNAIVWLSRRRIYMIKGTYEIDGLEALCNTLDQIKAECTEAVKAGLNAIKSTSG